MTPSFGLKSPRAGVGVGEDGCEGRKIRGSGGPGKGGRGYPAWLAGRTTRQGFPAARTFGGMSRVTTLPAPIVELSRMVTPGQTMTPPPIHTLSPIVTGFAGSGPRMRCSASSGWVAA
jgi:hypothetical protein